MVCGVAVVVTFQQQVLFGKRSMADGSFEWQLPGGWILPGESPRQAAHREVLEETGLELMSPKFIGLSNNIFSMQNHSISLYFEAECSDSDRLSVNEADKCYAWEWRYWAETNKNLYLPLRLFKQTDFQPFVRSHYDGIVQI